MESTLSMSIALNELQARTITAASDLAAVWIESVPGAREYVASGWGLAIELQMLPAPPRLVMSVVDRAEENKPRYVIAERVLG
jgi:hypothetical protein